MTFFPTNHPPLTTREIMKIYFGGDMYVLYHDAYLTLDLCMHTALQ